MNNLQNINDEIHPIRLDYEIAKFDLKHAVLNLEFTIKQSKEGNTSALLCLPKYNDKYQYAKSEFEKCKKRFISIGGIPKE